MSVLSNVRIHKISLRVVTFSVSAQYIHADIKNIIFLIFGGPQRLHTTKIVNEMLRVILFHVSKSVHCILSKIFLIPSGSLDRGDGKGEDRQ